MQTFDINNIADLSPVVTYIQSLISQHPIVALSGDLGTGKTTLVHAICDRLGVVDDVSSPTFSIINTYLTQNQDMIHHIDLYRLKTLDEALQIGIEDYLDQDSITFIEWPDLVEPLLPVGTLYVQLTHVEKERRKIVIL